MGLVGPAVSVDRVAVARLVRRLDDNRSPGVGRRPKANRLRESKRLVITHLNARIGRKTLYGCKVRVKSSFWCTV